VRPARFGLAESCEAVFQLFLLGWLHATAERLGCGVSILQTCRVQTQQVAKQSGDLSASTASNCRSFQFSASTDCLTTVQEKQGQISQKPFFFLSLDVAETSTRPIPTLAQKMLTGPWAKG
jgi:hypothetical protein